MVKMLKLAKILGVFAILFVIGVSSISGVLAQTRVPGVLVGDVFKYKYTFNLTRVAQITPYLPSWMP